MCNSDKKAFPSPRLFRPQIRRQFSWPLSAYDAVECIGIEVNDFNDTLSNYKRKGECTTVPRNDASTETIKGETKESRLNTMSSTKTTSYMQDWLLLREARIACKDIILRMEKKEKHMGSQLEQNFLTKEKDDVTIALATKMNKKTNPGKSNLFDFLFMLQYVPQQIFNVTPLSLGSYFNSLSAGDTVGISESMSNNLLRLSSFSTFPRNVNIYSSRFTNAGFYFTGNSDTVTCYSCGVSHSNWTSGDNPLEIHKRLNPNCLHIQNVYSQNNQQYTSPSFEETSASGCALEKNSDKRLNMKSDSKNTGINNRNSETMTSPSYSSTQVSEGIRNARTPTTIASGIQSGFQNSLANNSTEVNRDTRIQNGVEASNFQSTYVHTASNANSGPNQNKQTSDMLLTPNIIRNESARSNNSADANTPNLNTEKDVPNLGVNLEKPKYPNYAPVQVRISSYQNWPGYLDQTPQMMATAGFLYAGYNDYTRCFFCGGGLRNWEAGDDPWVEHARWFPKCVYLLQNKGARFIQVIQKKHQQVMAEQNNRENAGTNFTMQTATQSYQNETQANSAKSPPSSQNPLETIAARSVLEMGYTNEQVLQAIDKIMSFKKEATTISATDIMTVLLEENIEGNATSTASATTTHQHGSASTSGRQSTTHTTHSSTQESSMQNKSEHPSIENQNSSAMELLSSQAGTGKTSSTDELASALDDTENLLQENQQLRDQRLCKLKDVRCEVDAISLRSPEVDAISLRSPEVDVKSLRSPKMYSPERSDEGL